MRSRTQPVTWSRRCSPTSRGPAERPRPLSACRVVLRRRRHRKPQTVQVAEETVRAVREEWDCATVRVAAMLAATAALKLAVWWLCGRGFHNWEAWVRGRHGRFPWCRQLRARSTGSRPHRWKVVGMKEWIWWLLFGGLLIAALAYILYVYVFHYRTRRRFA